ncbi:MAG: tetratricopeptide repeat protein [Chloroflexi bacterium]|jgi:predicted ATPase|nr:tetratricopeptide repeat protein [Chloroflexota bacterium]
MRSGTAAPTRSVDGPLLARYAPDIRPGQYAADALGLREAPDQPIYDVLLDYLRERTCLLILDNCEHLIDASAQFAVSLLQACSDLKILASSREALAVLGEVPYRVPPLSLPDSHHEPSLEQWQQYDAFCLFVERATTVLPDFQITEDNLPSVVQICQRLDGLPLALELAAARVNVLTTAQIAARLDDRFRLLTGGSRTALPRQQTLRALIDWSWDLLDEPEKLLLRRLSVFAGSMNLEAVEAVCTGDGLATDDLLDLLSELVNKSLVIPKREQGQETRYRLLETIRQYAQEQLLKTSQIEKVRNRQLDYFLCLAEKIEPELVRSGQLASFRKLDKELDNLRAAQNWARETNVEAGLRLITAVWRYWAFSYRREGEHWLAKLLAHSDTVAPAIKAKALGVHAEFNLGLANLDYAHSLAQESLALYREINDQHGIALGLGHVGWATLWTGEHGKGRKLLLESLEMLRALDDKLGMASILSGLGFHEWKFNYERSMAYLAESEALYRELGHLIGILMVQDSYAQLAIWQGDIDAAQRMLEAAKVSREALGLKEEAYILQLFGDLYFRQGDYQQARNSFEKSSAISKEKGHYFTYIWAVIRMGHLCIRTGEYARAREYLEQSLRLFDEMGSEDGMIFAIEGFASLVLSQEQPEIAARLFGWSDTKRTANQDPRPPVEQVDVDRDTAVIIEMIGQETSDAAYHAGTKLSTEQAIAHALEITIT